MKCRSITGDFEEGSAGIFQRAGELTELRSSSVNSWTSMLPVSVPRAASFPSGLIATRLMGPIGRVLVFRIPDGDTDIA